MREKDSIIEDSGTYRGMDWAVRFRAMGFRCGYVRIEDEALFEQYVKDFDENNDVPSLDVHGGITFAEKLDDGNFFELSSGNWIGFDAAHWRDLNDYQSARKYFGNKERYDSCEQICSRHPIQGASIKTKEYMVAECKSLIDQILGEEK